ncbi:MAG TPA: HdeD family acid-resistance protein [Candidatus Dormibacteraeota bacterium]|nr:HdeD family acid-resistance protein [Candidatus Dormibacteraeota bacterium]
MLSQVLARNWWLLALRGLLAIAFGVLALLWPLATVLVLTVLFGAFMFVDGLMAVGYGLWGHRGWWLVVPGLLGAVFGLVAILVPGAVAVALVYLIAFWAIFRGAGEIVVGTQMGRVFGRQLLFMVAGALSILFGIVVIFFPGAAMLAIVWLISLYAVVLGMLLIAVAFRIRGWESRSPQPVG